MSKAPLNKDVNIILVDGASNLGKTTLARSLARQDESSYYLSLDRMSYDWLLLNRRVNHVPDLFVGFNSFALYHFSSPTCHPALIDELLRYLEFGCAGLAIWPLEPRRTACPTIVYPEFIELSRDASCRKVSDTFISLIIIEGYFISYLKEIGRTDQRLYDTPYRDLESMLKDNGYKNIFSVSLSNEAGVREKDPGFYVTNDPDRFATVGEDRYDINDNKYSELFERLYSDIKSKCIENVFPSDKPQYQDFGRLIEQITVSDSNSEEKYSHSNMDTIISEFPHTPSILDVGCNKGFFCYKFSELTDGSILGIDVSPQSIKEANNLNLSIFKKPNVKFKNVDFFDFRRDKKYDIVFCASTFHYFRDNQLEFINKVWSEVLAEGGVLVLEVEIYPSNNEPQQKPMSRMVDEIPCLFPNRKYLENIINGKFLIESTNKSCFQQGSYYDRYFFVMRRSSK